MRRFFTWLASRSAFMMGHPAAFLIATLACIIWAVTGPVFHYSDTWQLVINTATTVLTFLAVFLIQNSQNRDGIAIQAKLDEILMAVSKARTELVGIENLTDEEVIELKAAIEREALQPEVHAKGSQPTVEDILKNRDVDAEAEVERSPVTRAGSAKRTIAASRAGADKKTARKSGRRAPSAKKPASRAR